MLAEAARFAYGLPQGVQVMLNARHGAGRFACLHTAGLLFIALVRAFDGNVVISRIHVDRVESLVL
jgi:hypothetical protein